MSTVPTSTPLLRPMRWWDVGNAVAVERAAFPDDAWSPETFWSELAERATRTYLVAEVDAELVGYAGIAVVADEADLQTIAVAAASRGSGLGRQLLAAVTAAARAAGARRMHLEVRADNTPALGLYASTGWAETGRRRGYYRGAAGTVIDAVLMTRRLDR